MSTHGKRKRTESTNSEHGDLPDLPSCVLLPSPQSFTQSTNPDDLWKAILALDETTLRETLFQAAHAHPPTSLQVIDLYAALVEKGRSTVIDFTSYARDLATAVNDEDFDPRFQNAYQLASDIYEQKFRAVIKIIQAACIKEHANFETRRNGLEALWRIAKIVVDLDDGQLENAFRGWFQGGNAANLERSMESILSSLSVSERRKMREVVFDGISFEEQIDKLAEDAYNVGVFDEFEPVIELLKVRRDEGGEEEAGTALAVSF